AIVGTAIGFPLELFPLDPIRLRGGQPHADLTITRQMFGDRTILEATIRTDTRPEVRIRQTWAAGEKWWREYERSINGRKDLHARRFLPASSPRGRSGLSPPQDKQTELLSRDPRLQTLLTLNMKGQSLQALLDHLFQQTGVHLEMAANLASEDPLFGGLSMRGTPVWRVMQQLAIQNVIEGHWEKTEAGYRLLGAARNPAPPSARSHTDPRTKSTRRLRLYATLGATSLLIFSVLLVVRWRQKKAERTET
ncbi:MAG TPA: hypothetical protein VH682_15310, partial [Gemmataceae bacterium]